MSATLGFPQPQAPFTPDQGQPHLRTTADSPGSTTADSPSLHSSPAPPQDAPASAAYSTHLELALVRQRLSAMVEGRRAADAKLRACERDNAKLHCELQERCASYERNLITLEERHRSAAAAGAGAIAALAADNQRLAAQVHQLERTVDQLVADLHASRSDDCQAAQPSEGVEQIIAALQVEVAAMQRDSQAARRARAAAEQGRDALQQQADILRAQVEQMAERLDAEREHSMRLQAQFQAH